MNIQTYEPKGGWMAHYRRQDFISAAKDAALIACLVVLFVLYIFSAEII